MLQHLTSTFCLPLSSLFAYLIVKVVSFMVVCSCVCMITRDAVFFPHWPCPLLLCGPFYMMSSKKKLN